MKSHAASLAQAQKVTKHPRWGKILAPRLRDNRRVLEAAYRTLSAAVENRQAITSAGEWLIDNFHVVRAQIKDIHDHLPPGFYKELPKIAEGPLAGYPRVYGIAWAFVAHTDSRIDIELLKTFVTAYQEVQPLTIGELWALPITIQLVLIENLRRIAARVMRSQEARLEADHIADSLLGLGESEAKTVADVIRSLKKHPIDRSFAVQMLQRIRFQEDRVGELHKYLDQRLAEQNQIIEEWVTAEHNSQVSANLTTRNIITGCRLISAFAWADFFEEISIVDQILRKGSEFSSLDFATRDEYRHEIEELARRSSLSEIEIAESALPDVGFNLIGGGRKKFREGIGYRPTLRMRGVEFYRQNATGIYLGLIALLSVLMTRRALTDVPFPWLWSAPFIFLLASDIAVALVNRFTISLIGPRHLPALHLKTGIPAEMKTFVVVPTMFTDPEKIREQLEQIEIHYLSNTDENIYLALLTDFADSDRAVDSQDEKILETAQQELKALNDRHPVAKGQHPRFSVYHRRRVFNRNDDVWMGWERKRGKLHEFNQLLLGSAKTTFEPFPNEELRVPQGIRYVITLDADTKLPRGAAKRLVGTMAHPLNFPKIDERTGRVVSGYGILQPRVTPSLPTRHENTIFRRLTASRCGMDPYASAVSDIYQDLFDEGSFSGKGIYDLAAFDRAIQNRIPENSVLSHDLLEGNFARCGFLSDVQFIEDFPCHTGVATQRAHRWIRGDWQLLPWIFGSRGRAIPVIGRWKMFDNLRRSLVFPASFISLLVAGSLPWEISESLFLLIALSFIAPVFLTLWADLWRSHRTITLWQNFQLAGDEFKLGISLVFMNLALLPHMAWTAIDAVGRVLYRMFISRRNLLQWTTAENAKASASLEWNAFFSTMKGGVALTVVGSAVVLALRSSIAGVMIPVIGLWLASPSLARIFSLPPRTKISRPLSAEDQLLLRSTARRIWRFFTTFVDDDENFLPPDNFQEDPVSEIAHRSSPTNFGLYLLSVLAAKDFGWIGIGECVDRLQATTDSLHSLAKYEGHFYNWYDTMTLKPLEPRYISSVDNGNLVGHLVTVYQGCNEMLEQPIPNYTGFNQGIFDSLQLLEKEFNQYQLNHGKLGETFIILSEVFAEITNRLKIPHVMIENQSRHWESLRSQAAFLVKQAGIFAGDPPQPERAEILAWSLALQNDIQSLSRDFFAFSSCADLNDENLGNELSPENKIWWKGIRKTLCQPIAPVAMASTFGKIRDELSALKKQEKSAHRMIPGFIDPLIENLETSINESKLLIRKIQQVRKLCRQMIDEMDFKLLYDKKRKLFSIGLRVEDNQLDQSYYDLLASEARLTSFIAIAKGDVPVSHWFHLGRNLVKAGHSRALVSWSGSMFEYLMPNLIMHSPEGSLLDETCESAVTCQIAYAEEKKLPWGISESAYNKRDLNLVYQYSSFGLPELGLKRGLDEQLVVAPYATLMAAQIEPAAAAENLRRLEEYGALGVYGFYEAIDFSPSRLPNNQKSAVVKAFMAHHQGMALVALANVFKNSSMQRRFHADLSVRATELLLQERTPRTLGTLPTERKTTAVDAVKGPFQQPFRQYHAVNRPIPATQLLSNGNYTVMISAAGSGFSRVRDMAVTRWREDVTRDHYGTYFYLKDCESGSVWSAGYQPICSDGDRYEANFSEDTIRITRDDHEITSEMRIFVSSEENAEIRRISLTNQGTSPREIEITSYSEIVLNPHISDVAHPAFSNLFVETEFKSELSTILAKRRPRSDKDRHPWMMHLLRTDRHVVGSTQFETNRSLFLGRGRTVRNPVAIFENERLTNSSGPVLDPIASLRTRVRIEPGVTTHLTFVTGVADSREKIEIMAEKYQDPSIFKRASDLAWTQAQVKIHHLGIEPDEANLYQLLATRLIYLDPTLRAPSEILRRNSLDVTGLWALGISGDNPIVLVRIDDSEDRNLVRQLLRAQVYLATKGFVADLVIVNDQANSYVQDLQVALENMAQAAHISSRLSMSSGKVFVIRGDIINEATHILLDSEARVVLSTRHGSLLDQLRRRQKIPTIRPRPIAFKPSVEVDLPIPALEFFNGYGGFSTIEDEYVIKLKGTENTPAPWVNVIANPNFGFQVSESGAGYTWSANSRENQLTPWSNDPVCDPSGEAFYIYDRDTGALWSPTASPIRLPNTVYVCNHGQGYSRFETQAFGIFSELTQLVLPDQPVKISRLKIENRSRDSKRLSVSGYTEWVLGFSRASMAPLIVTEFDVSSRAIFAWNPRNAEHGKKIAFSALLHGQSSFTCDRTEFIGRNSAPAHPEAIFKNVPLRGASGGALDPCAAHQSEFDLERGEQVEIIFILGQAGDRMAARSLVSKIREMQFDEALTTVKNHWERLLGKVQVETPDRSFDLMINRWYLYQTISCRLWARAAFYQVGGAYGFRDQLQDVMSLTMSSPQMAREQILLAASRQFVEGDVQHWWHPPTGRGVRTHFSDDLLWLPYVVSYYLKVTRDYDILKEKISFLEGPLLKPGQEDSYDTPTVSQERQTLYEHCVRALNRSLKTGAHGLPLIGSGDWNDGLNHVGIHGQGESVWLAWFLFANLENFASLKTEGASADLIATWKTHASELAMAVEKNAWDGAWYRRAFYDDGSPIGSASNDECKIDSLAQTWAVLSGAGLKERAKIAMESVYEHLVKPDQEIILLLTPPFDHTPKDPGYIKGYVPGVRENGGQYTHAGAWVVMATALLGDGKKAYELFSYLNPINHSAQRERANRYKLEPFVVAGDVYSEDPNAGRGGWSWYTGAAGWLYRSGIEYLLGFQISGDQVRIRPCVPPEWKRFKIRYQYHDSDYTFDIEMHSHTGVQEQKLTLVADGKNHEVQLKFGEIKTPAFESITPESAKSGISGA